MKGVFNRFNLKVGDKKTVGTATVSAYEFKNKDNPLYNLRASRDGNSMLMMYDGQYIRLTINNRLFMSDTKMEKTTNSEVIEKASGTVLIAGLGIGLLLHNLEDKVKNGEVKKIIVVESNQDVIDLISPYYKDLQIVYVCADIFKLRAKEFSEEYGTFGKFDTIYFDIWENIDTDNLPEIAQLHHKFKHYKTKNGYMNSWLSEFLRNRKRQEDTESHYY